MAGQGSNVWGEVCVVFLLWLGVGEVYNKYRKFLRVYLDFHPETPAKAGFNPMHILEAQIEN